MREKILKKNISNKKIKEIYASLSEYTDAIRVKLSGVVIVHTNKIGG